MIRAIPGHQLHKEFKDATEAVQSLEEVLNGMVGSGYAQHILKEELKAKRGLIQDLNVKRYVEAPGGEVEICHKKVWDTLWILYREVNASSTSTPSITAAYNEVSAALHSTQTPLPMLGSTACKARSQERLQNAEGTVA